MKKIKPFLLIAITCLLLSYLNVLVFNKIGWLTIGIPILLGILFFLVIIIFKNPYYGLIVLILTLPFERVPVVHLASINFKIDQLIAGIMIIAWLGQALFLKLKLKSNPIGTLLFSFIGSMLISTLLAGNLNRAVMVSIFTVFMIIVSVVIVNLLDSKAKLVNLTKILLYLSLFLTLFGIYQFAGDMTGLSSGLTALKEIYTKKIFGFPRIQGFSMEPLYYADLLFIPLFLILTFLLQKKETLFQNKKLYILFGLIMLNFILTLSRGAYLGFAFTILIIVALKLKDIWHSKTVPVILGSGLIFFILAFAALSITVPELTQKFVNQATLGDFGKSESTVARLDSYQKSLEAWGKSPIFGIGPGNYGPYAQGYPLESSREGWDIVNNEYYEVLAEQGLIGLIIFALIIGTILIRSAIVYSKTKDETVRSIILGLTLAFIAILVQYLSFSTLYIMHIWVLIGLIIAVQNIALKEN